MWHGIFVYLAVVIIPGPTILAKSIHFHLRECSQSAECDPSRTHLSCLATDEENSNKMFCACKVNMVFDTSQLKCFLKVGAPCQTGVGDPVCTPGALCASSEDEEYNSVCRCGPNMIRELSGACRSAETGLLGKSCQNNNECESTETFFKCLAKDDLSGLFKECHCGGSAKFDRKVNKCVLITGADCETHTDANLNLQECEEGSTCIPYKDAYGSITSRGICCRIKDKSCNSFEAKASISIPISPPTSVPIADRLMTDDLYQKPCKTADDCKSPNKLNYLHCIEGACNCRRNNYYLQNTKACKIGIGSRCKLPDYNNKNPQKCISGAMCKPDMDKNGKELREGSCCSTKDTACQEFNPQVTGVKPAPHTGHTNLYRTSCNDKTDCNYQLTNLECIPKHENNLDKICDCGRKAKYFEDQMICLFKIDFTCDEHKRCIPEAECSPHTDSKQRPQKTGECKEKRTTSRGHFLNHKSQQHIFSLIFLAYKLYFYILFNFKN